MEGTHWVTRKCYLPLMFVCSLLPRGEILKIGAFFKRTRRVDKSEPPLSVRAKVKVILPTGCILAAPLSPARPRSCLWGAPPLEGDSSSETGTRRDVREGLDREPRSWRARWGLECYPNMSVSGDKWSHQGGDGLLQSRHDT